MLSLALHRATRSQDLLGKMRWKLDPDIMGCPGLRLIKALATLFAELRFSTIDFSAVGAGDLD
ncbi:MAG: hypothetical protein Q8S00_03000 [Deltaproteobacteria bacterium]|nr:hypothetical protein [Deltaproteobacteria bacterium]MDZ4347287.1 hypothetical protein [Candidatus Binatia bacterium]